MNQEYRERVKRHREAGGDEKYVNVKRKADARHSKAKALQVMKDSHPKLHSAYEGLMGLSIRKK